MFLKRNLDLYKIYSYLSLNRKRQLVLLFSLIIISGFFEAFSIASAFPFLALLSSPEKIFDIYLIRELANFLHINNPKDLFLPSTILFSLVVFFSTFVRLLNLWFISFFTAKLEVDLSNTLFEKNLYQTYSEFTKRNSSEIISILITQISASASSINAFIRSISSVVMALSISLSLLILNTKVSIIILIFITIYYLLISRKIKNFLLKNSYREAELNIQAIRVVQEAFGAFRDITINNTQKIYLNDFVKKMEKIKFINVFSNFLLQFPRYLLEAFVLVLIIIVSYFLTNATNDLSFLTLIGVYAFGAQKLLPIIQQIYGGWAGYQSKAASIKYVLIELERKSIRNNLKLTKNVSIEKFNYLLFKDIFYSYQKKNNNSYVLNGVNLIIKKGDYVGIYGKTGSGKSTFLDLLMGLLVANKGKIFFNEIDLYQRNNLYSWRNLISHVSQDIFIKEGSIEENIAFNNSGDLINYELLCNSSKIANIYNFINNLEFGFKTIVGERGIRLSGGQKQRISIARALYQNKKIIVLDEATSALDEKTEEEVINAIRNYDKKITIIMVTHRIKSLSNCNKIFKVADGLIIEES